mmetsp:Transcript_54168/g.61993  ORF Transcript_54168/g.61993 Transcript_54168/m.61993 type:complete len:471 (+) Transcript_54168:954-2366(+)
MHHTSSSHLQESGTSQYISREERDHQRYEQLRAEFAKIDANNDGQLSKEEIITYIQGMTQGHMNAEAIDQVFKLMDRDRNAMISVEEFINGFMELENQYEKKIDALSEQIQQDKIQRDDTREKLLEAKRTEKVNKYGIMQGSILTVTVERAENLEPMDMTGTSDPYAVVKCEGRKDKTEYQTATLNPVWGSSFTFDVTRPDGIIEVEIWDHDTFNSNDFEGKVEIPLVTLKDQQRIDDWFRLKNSTGEPLRGKVFLGLQWIHSRVTYLADIIEDWDENITEDEKDLEELKEQLFSLQDPVNLLIKADSVIQVGKKEISAEDSVQRVVSGTLGIENVPMFTFTFIAVGIFFICTTLTLFHRPAFVDMTVGFMCWYFVILRINPLSSKIYRLLAASLSTAAVYDLFWLVYYTYHWTIGSSIDNGMEDNIRRFVLLFSLLAFLYKIPFAALMWKNSIAQRDIQLAQSRMNRYG